MIHRSEDLVVTLADHNRQKNQLKSNETVLKANQYSPYKSRARLRYLTDIKHANYSCLGLPMPQISLNTSCLGATGSWIKNCLVIQGVVTTNSPVEPFANGEIKRSRGKFLLNQVIKTL